MARQSAARATVPDPGPVDDTRMTINAVVNESDQAIVRSFLSGLVPFFRRSTELERHALDYQRDSKTLVLPTNGEEDARIQSFIKTGSAAKKTLESHWDICQAVSRLHRALTGKRGIGVAALEDGALRAQRLHNTYVENARRRAQEEEERQRREAEERARIQQEREAAQLEQQALDAEAGMQGLSDREDVFVEQFHKHGNGTLAAKTAGYKDPGKAAMRLLDTPKIVTAIKAKETADASRRQAAAVRAQPAIVNVEPVKADVQKVGTDRTTWSGEIVDEVEFIHAVMSGKHGIPLDVLQINQKVLNDYARSLETRLDLWPGVRAKKSTRTI